MNSVVNDDHPFRHVHLSISEIEQLIVFSECCIRMGYCMGMDEDDTIARGALNQLARYQPDIDNMNAKQKNIDT